MSLYTRARNHFDMRRVKELNENKIIKQIAADREHLEGSTKSENKFNWRKDLLREFGEWVPIEGSGPTNGSTTTFGYYAFGELQLNYETEEPITFTYSGLDGIANYPTSITIDQGFGEVHTTNPPPFSAIGVQGYTAKLNPKYKKAQEEFQQQLDEFRKKEDANFQSIKDTLKSFGTSWDEMRASKKWVRKLSDETVVAIIPTDSNPSPMNWTNNVRVVKLKKCANASGPMSINYYPPGQYQDWVVENSEIQSEVYLQIGEQPKEPMESQYLMPRRNDFKDINPQLDASQEFAQKVGADYMMNARVQDTSPTPAYYPTDQSTVPGMVWIDNPMSINGGHWEYDSSKTKVASTEPSGPLGIDDFKSAADYSAYKNGGGDAARAQGRSVDDIIGQGIQNIQNWDNTAIRALRSFTDNARYAGKNMWQGGPSTRPPGVSNYWSPDPRTAAGYSNPGGGYPGAKPNPSGTLAQAPRPANTPRVSRSVLGQPQFKFQPGTTVDNFISSAADDVATAAAEKVALKGASKLGRLVPGLGATIAIADVSMRTAKGDYLGATLGGLSAVPGPVGWLGLGLQITSDLTGMSGGDYRESYSSYEEYLNFAKTVFNKIKAPEDPRGYVRGVLKLIKDNKDLTDDDKIILTLVLTGDTRDLEVQDLQKVTGHLFNLSKNNKKKKKNVSESTWDKLKKHR
jgi:hypothetical protein